jgi:ADP-ribosylation factor-like protein 13B
MSSGPMKGIRELSRTKVPSKQTHHNSRLAAKITATSDYFLEKVDPLIGPCIAYMLLSMPIDVPQAMLTYFEELRQTNRKPEYTLGVNAINRPRRDHKLFLASSIGPVIAKLVNRIAFSRPVSVVDFLLTELDTMVKEEAPITMQSVSSSTAMANAVNLADAMATPFPFPNSALSASFTVDRSRPESAPITTEKLLSPRSYAQMQQSSSYSNLPVAAASNKSSRPEEPARIIQIAVLGIGGAGKTSLLNVLQGEPGKKTKPTNGFSPISMSMAISNEESETVRFYDLGGGDKIRAIWDQYYHDVHGVVYVIDSSAEAEAYTSAIELCNATISNKFLVNKPILFVANKQDIAGSRPVEAVRTALGQLLTGPSSQVRFVGSSAPASDAASTVNSEELERGVEWLLQSVNTSYEELHARVAEDIKVKLQLEAAKRLEKERRVLRNKIVSAFPTQVKKEFIFEDTPMEPEDCFSQVDGEAFLAGEIGIDAAALCPEARAAAASVGYQRLALQMMGALHVPISKKKDPFSWPQILDIISQLRTELGLSPPIVLVGVVF